MPVSHWTDPELASDWTDPKLASDWTDPELGWGAGECSQGFQFLTFNAHTWFQAHCHKLAMAGYCTQARAIVEQSSGIK